MCFLLKTVLFFLCLGHSFADSKVGLYKKKCVGDTDIFDINYASISCYGECTFGSTGTFYATYTIGDELSTTEPFVTVKAFNVEAYNDTVDICNDGTISNKNGYYCPSIGTYSFHTPMTLPGSGDSIYSKLSFWWTMSAYARFDFDDAEVVCQFKIEGRYTRASQNIFGGSAILLVGFFTLRTRRRIIVKEKQSDPIEIDSRFVKMGDD